MKTAKPKLRIIDQPSTTTPEAAVMLNTSAATPVSVSVPMTLREVRFANAYLEHGNATQAAREAGCTSASAEGLRYMAHKILTKPNVAGYIAEVLGKYLDAERVTESRILSSLSTVAFGSRLDVFDEKGWVLPMNEWPEEMGLIVAAFEVKQTVNHRTGEVTGRWFKIRFHSPLPALNTLGEWLGMFGPKRR